MNDRMENLMYHSGLTASGCWDDMDDYAHKAIEKLAELIVKETLQVAKTGIEFGPSMEEAVYTYFGIKE